MPDPFGGPSPFFLLPAFRDRLLAGCSASALVRVGDFPGELPAGISGEPDFPGWPPGSDGRPSRLWLLARTQPLHFHDLLWASSQANLGRGSPWVPAFGFELAGAGQRHAAHLFTLQLAGGKETFAQAEGNPARGALNARRFAPAPRIAPRLRHPRHPSVGQAAEQAAIEATERRFFQALRDLGFFIQSTPILDASQAGENAPWSGPNGLDLLCQQILALAQRQAIWEGLDANPEAEAASRASRRI